MIGIQERPLSLDSLCAANLAPNLPEVISIFGKWHLVQILLLLIIIGAK